MATRDANRATPLGTGGTAFELLLNARKAWIYTYLRRHPETPVRALVDELDIPQRTVYEYVDELEAAGFIEQSNEGRPATYTALDVDLQLIQGDAERRITPALIEAVARGQRDDDIETYLDRHGLDGLAVALDYAREHADGSVTHRIMAREQSITPMEAGIILDALRPVVEE
ncbi:DUF7437 domain-containing protein [Halorubrum trueperi]|uniref:Helix-turn-helix domain-containing protein n=1 Tax=Halorubrum trueperi TaxID=2004704 RepID=A0ABD5UE37_9EURY